jgi:hypothetical protein
MDLCKRHGLINELRILHNEENYKDSVNLCRTRSITKEISSQKDNLIVSIY